MRLSQLIVGAISSIFAITSVLATNASYPRCKEQDLVYRKEWRALSKPERKDYIEAVRCIQTKKPTLYHDIKGAKSRFDDFLIVHIEQTFIIHFNAQFFGWHRWFVWAYEQTLIKDCGYQGAQPYWDWTLDADNYEKSPIFDPSSGFGGNGKKVPHSGIQASINLPPVPEIKFYIPPGSGGGCVTTGPFANLIVNFGPIKVGANTTLYNNPKNLAYNPHCLVRDFNQAVASVSINQTDVDVLLSQPDIASFLRVINAGAVPGIQGLHSGGHISVGGEMADFFSSPGDPLFFLHHAQIDRLWTLWQNKDLKNREYAITGTGSFLNYPPTPEFKLSDTIDLGRLSPQGPLPLSAVLSTRRGPFCYAYEEGGH